ncbi:TPA: hypothetical protein ACKNYC_001959, partial [Neisseria gonorrhoeae]
KKFNNLYDCKGCGLYAGHYGGNTVWEAVASHGVGTAGDAPMPSGVKAGKSAVWKKAMESAGRCRLGGERQ